MKITSIPNYNYRPNYISSTNSKVTFGEMEGNSCSFWNTRMSTAQYEEEKRAIEAKYSEMRASWIKICNNSGTNDSDMWKGLNRIKNQEVQALDKLESEYVG